METKLIKKNRSLCVVITLQLFLYYISLIKYGIIKSYIIGLDYGSDSVRAGVIDSENGNELASEVHGHARWKNSEYCEASINQFRQYPLDHIEG